VSPADIEKQDADGSEIGSPNDPRSSIDVPKQYDTNRAKYAEEVFDCIYKTFMPKCGRPSGGSMQAIPKFALASERLPMARAQVVAETRAWFDAHPEEAQGIVEIFAPQATA